MQSKPTETRRAQEPATGFIAPGSLHERLLAADPDLSRLRLALRATLTTGLSALLLSRLRAPLGLGATAPILGAAVAMMASIAVTEPDPRDARITFALLPLPAVAALVVGTLSAPHPWLSLALFVITIFISVAAQRFGARGTALGLLAFNVFFFALFFQARAGDLLGLAAATVIGLLVASVVRFGLVPQRSPQTARRVMRALPALVSRALGALAQTLTDGASHPLPMRRALQRLNEGALTLDDHLARASDDALGGAKASLRRRAFALEIAAGRVASGVLEIARDADAPAPARDALARALVRARRAVHGDVEAAAEARGLAAEAAGMFPASPRLAFRARRLATALEALFGAAAFDRAGAEREDQLSPAESPVEAPEPEVSDALHASTRTAIQTAVACALAVVAGRWISPERWFWAVLAAYIVIAPATTRGEIFVRAWSRCAGTVAGVFVGMLLATAVGGNPRVELALVFLCIFLGLYSIKTSYTTAMVWFTALLAILYSLLGRYSPAVLYVRIAETVAGASIGAVTAALVLPARTGLKVRQKLERALSLVADELDRLAHTDGAGSPARELDRALLEVRSAAEPFTRGTFRVARETVELAHGASALAFYIRQLAVPGLLDAAERESHGAVATALGTLAANTRSLTRALAGEEVPLADVGAPLGPMREAAEVDPPRALTTALLCLERLDHTIAAMHSALLPARRAPAASARSTG